MLEVKERENLDPVLHINNMKTILHVKNGAIVPVDGIELIVSRGKMVGLVGESGCGKSMTALSVMNLLPNNGEVLEGEILFEGEDLLKMDARQLRNIYGNRLTMIFQEPMSSLNPVITVGRQVTEVLQLHRNLTKTEARHEVVEIFRQVGIPDAEERFSMFPFQLSGGLRQRVMISAAMICQPSLIIADEPTTALDVTIEAQILHLMRKLQKEKNTSVLMITHNLGVVAEVCDELYIMYAGRIMEYANVFDFFKRPLHPYAIGLLDSLPSLSQDKYLKSIPGTVPGLYDMPSGCRFAPRCRRAKELCRQVEPELTNAGGGHLVRCHFYHESEE